MAAKSYKPKSGEAPKAAEPASVYYSQPLVNALKRNIQQRVEEEKDPEVLSKVCALLDKEPQEASFEERFERAKALAYARFSKDKAQQLEAQNFYIDRLCPITVVRSKDDLDTIIAEYEAADEEEILHEDMMKELKEVWRNVL